MTNKFVEIDRLKICSTRAPRPRTAGGKSFIFAVLLLLAGCAQLPVEPEAVDFRIEGKVGVVEGDRSYAARFIWRQTGARYDVALWGPLGQGGTRLRGDAEMVEIVGKRGGPVLSGHPQSVMRDRFGWSLPLAVLPWWMSGKPAPHGPLDALETDSEGRLAAFRQLGWQVRLDRFEAREGLALPGRIMAERPGYRFRVTILNR